jgi:hypothetical protein
MLLLIRAHLVFIHHGGHLVFIHRSKDFNAFSQERNYVWNQTRVVETSPTERGGHLVFIHYSKVFNMRAALRLNWSVRLRHEETCMRTTSISSTVGTVHGVAQRADPLSESGLPILHFGGPSNQFLLQGLLQ